MHNKSLANNPQKLPTVSLKLRTFKYFSLARTFYCNASVLAEGPFPVLPHNKVPTFLLNHRWQNLSGSLPAWAGQVPDFISRQAEGRRFTLWETSSIETANGNDLPWQRSGVVESRSEAIRSTGSSSAPFTYIYRPCRRVSCLFRVEEIR